MPEFSVDGYGRLLDDLTARSVALHPVSAMPNPPDGPVAYLRHDIDLHVPGVERIAQLETDRGASATYFVMLTQHYNPLYPANRQILRLLVEMGHEIGLHYDLMTYPPDRAEAIAHLDWELDVLSTAVGCEVASISMHQPYEGRPDVLLESQKHLHPHDPRWAVGLTYVSDSCRAWRDESLLDFLDSTQTPRRLLLLTHPELWLDGEAVDRTAFLETSLLQNVVRQATEFVEVTVRSVWDRHPGPVLHDAREPRRAAG